MGAESRKRSQDCRPHAETGIGRSHGYGLLSHAQQCVEKYLKALLVLHGIEFERVHQIGALISRLPARLRPDLTQEEQERLTDYAVSTRYPGDYERIPLAEARQAVQIARRVRKHIRPLLPKAALRPL